MAVTIEDIARRVGKSITTVSRALHDYNDVSAETKALVQQVATEMGYVPSTMAQRLQKQRSDTIGLILPTFGPRFSDPFFSEIIAGIGNRAAKLGYDLLVSTRPPGEEEERAYRDNVQSRRVDGFLVVRTRRDDRRIKYLREVGFPFVAFGRTNGDMGFPYVDEDGEWGMGLLAEHLLEMGHRRIGCILAPRHFSFSQHRLNGLLKGLQDHGLKLDPSLVYEADLTERGGYQAAKALLALQERPTAIVSCNDLMALGAIRAAQEEGFAVGKDISITGFDDIPMAEYAHPPLTTVRQPIYQIGAMVCKMLIQLIQRRPLEQNQVLLKPTLMIRQSSGPLPG